MRKVRTPHRPPNLNPTEMWDFLFLEMCLKLVVFKQFIQYLLNSLEF